MPKGLNESLSVCLKVIADVLYAKGFISIVDVERIYDCKNLDNVYQYLDDITVFKGA